MLEALREWAPLLAWTTQYLDLVYMYLSLNVRVCKSGVSLVPRPALRPGNEASVVTRPPPSFSFPTRNCAICIGLLTSLQHA